MGSMWEILWIMGWSKGHVSYLVLYSFMSSTIKFFNVPIDWDMGPKFHCKKDGDVSQIMCQAKAWMRVFWAHT